MPTHFINVAAVDPSQARTPSLIATQPQPFPILFVGDTPTHRFFFQENGAISAFSGDSDYALRVTIGDPNAGPFGGTFVLTCDGQDTAPLEYDILAIDLEAALNSLATVAAEGGVNVTGTAPTFSVFYKTSGSVTTITENDELLAPDSTLTVTVLTTGDATHRQQLQIALRRDALAEQTTWSGITSPYAGWSATLSTTTGSAYAELAQRGASVGGFFQFQTLVTAEVINAAAEIVAYYQTTIILREKPGVIGSPTPLPPAVSAQAVQNRPAIVGLASVTEDATKLGGLPTDDDAIAAGAVYCVNFLVTINDGAGTHTGTMTLLYQLQAGVHAQSFPFWIQPFDYDASANAKVWKLIGAFLDGCPASYNGITGKLHYMVLSGAADAVTLYPDQTGSTIPA